MKKPSCYIPLVILLATVLLGACGTKKNTPMSRFWQKFTTKYNVYYNGMTHYNEQIKVLENDYEDDYSQRLFIHPAEAYSNPKSPQPSTNFTRTIEKMQKAISLHSIKKKPKRKAGKGNDAKYREWMKRDEYNPFIHHAWYMLAKAEYMKGDFLASSATFHYIARHFTWKPKLVLECQIWEALSYCAMGWTTEADNILAHVHPEKIEDKRLRALANLAFANYYIKDKRIAKAIPHLAAANKGFSRGERVRLNFLLGQLYEDNGQKELAYQAYKRAGSSMGATYRTKFNARIKQSAVFQGNDIKGEVNSLRHLARYDRNKEYLDQIYYAIGNLYMTKQDTTHAIENYVKAAEKSTRNGIDKAISQLRLGGIYFAQRKYDKAQPCYAEAVPLLNEDYPNYKAIKKRSDVLDELAVYAGNVTLQDSLLTLSKMPLDEQKKVIKKIIDALKKKEKEDADAAKREEYLAQQNAKGNPFSAGGKSQAPTQFSINNDKSWYFYNTAIKNSGKTEFQKLWGNRKLEDNWRRRNKATFSLSDQEEELESNDSTSAAAGSDTTSVDKERLKREEDPHYEEYYLKQIPKTEEEIQTSNNVIQEGIYNMALILKDKLEDYSAAAYQFEELLRRYPDNENRLDAYYNMYLLFTREGNIARAEDYRQRILTDFADSKYGEAMKDPNYLENLKKMDQVQEAMYADAYQAYLANDNKTVHEAYRKMMNTYPLSKLMPKFMFIDALAYVTQKDADKFKEVLKELLQRYPETDLTPVASSMVKQLNQGRKLSGGGSNLRGMSWSSFRLGNDSTASGSDSIKFTPLKEAMRKPQYFVLAYSLDSVSSNQVLFEVARHNFNTFKVQDFDLEQLTFGGMGLLIVKGFGNYTELLAYRTMFERDKKMTIPPGVHQVLISEENFNTLVNEGRTFEDYFLFLEEQNNQAQAAKIPDTATDDNQLEHPQPASKTQSKSVRPGQKAGKGQAAQKAKENQAGKATRSKKAAEQRAKAEQARLEAEKKARLDSLKAEEQQRIQDSIAQSKLPTVIPDNPDLVIDDGTVEEDTVEQPADSTHILEKAVEPKLTPDEPVAPVVEETDVRQLKKHKTEEEKQKERQRKDDEKAKKKAQKEEAKAKADAKKQRERERKEKLKAREAARKQKMKERKQRQKQREAERKAYQKKKKAEAKARKEAARKR